MTLLSIFYKFLKDILMSISRIKNIFKTFKNKLKQLMNIQQNNSNSAILTKKTNKLIR